MKGAMKSVNKTMKKVMKNKMLMYGALAVGFQQPLPCLLFVPLVSWLTHHAAVSVLWALVPVAVGWMLHQHQGTVAYES